MRPEPPAYLDEIARAVIGAAIEVHRQLGPGFLEAVYEAALAKELEARGIGFARQVPIPLTYRDETIGEHRLDFLVEDALVIELKAVDALAVIHSAQTLSYLRAGSFRLGLLINFNTPLLKAGIRRIINPL